MPYANCGMFTNEWNNPPPPFNPEYIPYAKKVWAMVAPSMEADGFYDNHTREECKVEWRKRYEKLMEKYAESA